MTTIILTIIGILLAAAAALMVIFYGGDAFISGTKNAAAASYQNAGQNVLSALALYEGQNGSVNGATLSTLTSSSCINGGSCLSDEPTLPVSIDGAPPEQSLNDGQYIITNIDRSVCEQVNNNLKSLTNQNVGMENQMGCALAVSGPGIFYANFSL